MAISNKVAIVTGAGTGVGKASALALLEAGYNVALAGRRVDLLEAAAAEGKAGPSKALVVQTDVGVPESVRALFAKTMETFGRLVEIPSAGHTVPADQPAAFARAVRAFLGA